jgi:CheY-like chemotaxis protein
VGKVKNSDKMVDMPVEPHGDGERPVVVVVDDEPTNLELLVRTLEAQYTVHAFCDAREALQQIPGLKPELLLTDYRMPGMTGVQLLRALREGGMNLSSVLVTGFAELDEVVRASEEMLVTRVVAKPWRPKELRTQVELALGLHRLKNKSPLRT